MGDKTFEQEVLERLKAIETHGEYFAAGLETIKEHCERITATEESVKNAHKRIDGICATAGILGGMAGWITQLIASLWPKGGH